MSISYDSLSGAIEAEPVRVAYTLTTDLGDELPMAPARQGGYRVSWDAQPGNYGFQILQGGQPVTVDGIVDAPRTRRRRRRRERRHHDQGHAA